MKSISPNHPDRCLTAAFTLTETVIAIGVLAVLLTGFLAVFTPAAQGIRRSISSEQADQLTTTLETELVTARHYQPPATNQYNASTAITGFDKAFSWIYHLSGIPSATKIPNAIFVYQYRGNPAGARRRDGTLNPVTRIQSRRPGAHDGYVVQTMARRGDDPYLETDLKAVEGSVFFVRPTQLVFENGELKPRTKTTVGIDNADGSVVDSPDLYTEAVIAFTADFYSVPSKTYEYLTSTSGFGKRFGTIVKPNSTIKPIFSRNLAVRR